MNLPNDPTLPTAKLPSAPEENFSLLAKVATGLALLTFLIFLPVASMNWVNYDDDVFVTDNPKVAGGVTWEGIKWAFTAVDIDYWRPVSWLSHMLDVELFGSVAGYHHLTNLLIHMAAAVMLLLAMNRLTGMLWPSAMVAALFAWHPLHVESVAWIAERKDVLCGFFWFYTVWAYAGYVREPTSRNYLRVFFGFVFGVMSKPMVVTLPFALLLLDWWPLNRLTSLTGWQAIAKASGQLLKEKIPLFAVVVVLCISTFYAQHNVGAMSTLEGLPLRVRVPSALAAYGTYLGQTILPAHLCVLYPRPFELDTWKWLVSSLLLVVLTATSLVYGRRLPFLPVGWFWFLGVLVPVIGLVQVGEQAHADRYTYIPLVGVFILCTWGAITWAQQNPNRARWLPPMTVGVLLICAVLTRLQLRHWENSVTLFTRAATVTEENLTALNNAGAEMRSITQFRESIQWLERAVRIHPTQGAVFNLALSHNDLGESMKARYYVYRAFKMDPKGKSAGGMYEILEMMAQAKADDSSRWQLLAIAAQVRGDNAAAIKHLGEVIRTDPRNIEARVDRAAYLAQAGQEKAAVVLLHEVATLSPTNAVARGNLAALLVKNGQFAEGLPHYEAALKVTPENPDLRHNYALLLSRTGKVLPARMEFESILRAHPKHVPALQQLAWLLATRAECRDPAAALRLVEAVKELSPPTAALHDVMAACHAAAGEFDLAVTHATAGLSLARGAKQTELENAIRSRLQLYSARQPYTAP